MNATLTLERSESVGIQVSQEGDVKNDRHLLELLHVMIL